MGQHKTAMRASITEFGATFLRGFFVEINTLHFGVYDAIATYNKGNIIKCDVLRRRGLKPGQYTIKAMRSIDRERIRNAERAQSDWENHARQKRRGAKGDWKMK